MPCERWRSASDVVRTMCCPTPQLYLEPFELTFNVYFQSGEHGLVLMGQVLESAEVTVTGTPRSCWIPSPSSLASVPGAVGSQVPGGELVKVRQQVTDAQARAGRFGGVGGSDPLTGGADAERGRSCERGDLPPGSQLLPWGACECLCSSSTQGLGSCET